MPKVYRYLDQRDEDVFVRALQYIWSIVAWDCLTGAAEERGIRTKRTEHWTLSPAEQVTVPRSTVICITVDHLAGGMHSEYVKMPKDQYQRIREWLLTTPEHIVAKRAKKAFPEKRFGA